MVEVVGAVGGRTVLVLVLLASLVETLPNLESSTRTALAESMRLPLLESILSD